MAQITRPPATCTIGSEIPKKRKIVDPSTSNTARKMTLLIAILRASARYTSGGAAPASPRNTSADPSGLISGNSALNAIRNELQTSTGNLLLPYYEDFQRLHSASLDMESGNHP